MNLNLICMHSISNGSMYIELNFVNDFNLSNDAFEFWFVFEFLPKGVFK